MSSLKFDFPVNQMNAREELMKIPKLLITSEHARLLVIGILLGICFFLTYYFHTVLQTGGFFNHFFYIPIILSAFWWKRKGVFVALFSAAFLVFSHLFLRMAVESYNDYFRAFLFLITAIIVAVLSERVAKSEQSLRESEVFHRITLSSMLDAIFITNDEGRFTFVGSNANVIFGYSPENILQMGHISNIFGEDLFDPEAFSAAKVIKNIEKSITDKSGIEHILLISVRRVNIRAGSILYTCRDVTERKNAQKLAAQRQQQLIQADKLVTLGILVSGVAHEINNPNNFIMLNSEMLSRLWKEALEVLDDVAENRKDLTFMGIPYKEVKTEIQKLFEGIEKGVARIQKIVQNLKRFSQYDTEEKVSEFNFSQVVDSALVMTGNLIEKSTKHFKMEIQDNLPEITGNHQQLEQVLINLITNACQALTSNEESLSITVDYDERMKMIVAKIGDEGEGIDSEDLRHVMDPFFTRKQNRGGTGLGLSISYNIVKSHNGELQLESQKGVGTTAIVSLPVLKGSETINKLQI